MTRVLMLAAALAAFGLSACDTMRKAVDVIVDTRDVNIAVATPCDVAIAKIDMGPQKYADTAATIAAAPDVATRGQLVLLGNRQREQRLTAVEPALRICAGLPPLPADAAIGPPPN